MIDSGGKYRHGFTLIELLVTVGIMAVVVTLTIPSFSGLGRGVKMNSALSGLKTTMSLARQWAISHRDEVYVVFPAGRVREGCGIWPRRTCMVFSDNDEDFIKEPLTLPEGIIISDEKFSSLSSGIDNFPNEIQEKINDVAQAPIYYIIFRQDGSLNIGASTAIIALVEGVIDERGNASETFGTGYDAVKVNGITGLSYIERDIDRDS